MSAPDTPARNAARRPVRVKVCGITSVADAVVAEAAGADAVGMIFAPGSKRRVTPETAADICSALGPFVARIGVFVDADVAEVVGLARGLRLTGVQLHGAESAAYAREVAKATRVVRALPYAPGLVPADVADYGADAVLLDAATPGSGLAFAWEAAAPAWRAWPRLVLAGGLTPDNVSAAIGALRPYAVDVASGVETRPGVKDPEAVRAFVSAAKDA